MQEAVAILTAYPSGNRAAVRLTQLKFKCP